MIINVRGELRIPLFGQDRSGGLLETNPEPAQVAASITLLLPDDGVNVSGVVLASDGGWSAQ